MILDPIILLAIGIVLVVGGIIGLKLHPFLALLLGAFVVAILTPASILEQFALSKGWTQALHYPFLKKVWANE
jgi:GntP family gluconate:H+ symporter